jgi:hypothetical protein
MFPRIDDAPSGFADLHETVTATAAKMRDASWPSRLLTTTFLTVFPCHFRPTC